MALLQITEPGQAVDPHLRKRAAGIDLGTTNSLIASVRAGVTQTLPSKDRVHTTRVRLLARIRLALAGRAAEELVFGHLSTGAAGDLARAGSWQQRTLNRLHRSLQKIRKLDPTIQFRRPQWDALLEAYFNASKSE